MDFKLTAVVIALIFYAAPVSAWETKTFWEWGCPGTTMTSRSCTEGVLELKSITLYSSTNADAIVKEGAACRQSSGKHECERRITTSDPGLSDEYRHFYEWVLSKCNGRKTCEPIDIPQHNKLTGETANPVKLAVNGTEYLANCPKEGIKYVSGVYIHFECRAGEEITTVTEPPTTPAKTRPTTPTTTTSFPVVYKVYLPRLSDRERIILGVAIGLAVAILIVLLIVLYCCERWHRKKKFGKLLRMLGRPQAIDDGFDDLNDYGTPEAWKDETNHPDALGEYTGVKPDEFMTIDKKAMEKSGLIYSDHVGTMTTLGRANTASTLNLKGNGTRPSVEPGTGYVNGAVNYETDENLELERRMAAVLNKQESVLNETDAEEVSKH